MPNQIALRDGFSVEEKNPSNSLIVGRILKFKDGQYSVDKNYHPGGGRYGVRDVVFCWVHWQDGKPVEHRITAPGDYHPERDELPDQDQELWPAGINGPSDPWRDTRYLQLIDQKTGADYTFITDTHGGHRGVGDLKAQIRNVRQAHSGAVPIIALGTTMMKTKYGMRPRPQFDVADWIDKQQDAPLLLGAPDGDEYPFEE
jgi:hypothetical protein